MTDIAHCTDDDKSFRNAIRAADIEVAKELLNRNPRLVDNLYTSFGAFSAMLKKGDAILRLVRMLITHGWDVNGRPKYNSSPLSIAVRDGSIDLARLLLEHCARTDIDRPLIAALHCDDESLRLPLIQLLVEHGAVVNQIFELYDTKSYFTVLDWAEDPAIIAYLEQHGAKKAKELRATPIPEPEGDVRELLDYCRKQFGQADPKPLVNALPEVGPYRLYVVRPEVERQHYTIFTYGLSTQPMSTPDGEDEWQFAELYMQLPGDWALDKLGRPEWNWPLVWLRKISQYPFENNTWLGGAFTIIANDEPPQPLGPNTELSCLMLLANKSFKRSDGQEVHLYQVTPLHTSERDLERRDGVTACRH